MWYLLRGMIASPRWFLVVTMVSASWSDKLKERYNTEYKAGAIILGGSVDQTNVTMGMHEWTYLKNTTTFQDGICADSPVQLSVVPEDVKRSRTIPQGLT